MVVLQINKFFWLKGGSERYFFMVSDELESRGHQVIQFSMEHPNNRPSPYADYFVSRKDYEDSGPGRSALAQGFSFIRSREAARNIRSLVRDHRPDVAHLHNIYHQLTPSIIVALREAGVPVVMTLHDYKLTCPNYDHFDGTEYCYRCRGGRFHQAALTKCNGGSFGRSALLAVEAYWQRISGVYGGVDRFIAPSRFMRERVAGAAGDIGIDADRVVYLPSYCPPADGSEALSADERAVLDGLPERFVLYFGRVSVEKGLDTFMQAARALPDVEFVICGDGPRRATFEQSAPPNVRFTGYVNKPLLDRALARATAVVLPAIWPENAPFTVIEAAAAGVPVVVSDMGGLPEMAEIVSGMVFPHGNAGELGRQIKSLWDNPGEARERGEAGRQAAGSYFDKERHMESLEQIYGEVTKR
ncbi:MAG: glycosyltransferase family 4 protein [Candidatus Krumholzibacteria bacterium]|nr:glycosyltransferase family 4 protein [Candidatus Krumholzibacteria bacterium]